MSARTLEELREHVRARSENGAPVSDEELQAFIATTKDEIDRLYENYRDEFARTYFAEPPGGWPPLPPPTLRQRLGIWDWKARRLLAMPFVWVVRVLDPSAITSGDD